MPENKWRNAMKLRMLLILCTTLVLTLSKSVPCMAQFEIAPDHFDSPDIEQISRAGTIAKTKQAAGSFQGRFTLLHEVNYAGVTLPPGTYSLSIRSRGSWDLATLVLNGSDARIQTHLKRLSGTDGPTALVLERTGPQRTLTGISFHEPGTILYLQGAQSRTIPAESEVVPVSHVTGRRTAN